MSLYTHQPMEAYSPAAPPPLPVAASVEQLLKHSLLTRWWATDRASG